VEEDFLFLALAPRMADPSRGEKSTSFRRLPLEAFCNFKFL
jgi:hypothetical protein